MANSLYPGFLKISYTGNAHGHKMVVPVFPDLILGVWNLVRKDAVAVTHTAGVATLVTVAKALLATTDGFTSSELWTLASPTADPVFQESIVLTDAGTSGAAPNPNSQAMLSMRTALGGRYRFMLMEQTLPDDQKNLPPFGASAWKTISDYLIGGTSIVQGRDGGRLSSPISFITKENDALRKKYFLNT